MTHTVFRGKDNVMDELYVLTSSHPSYKLKDKFNIIRQVYPAALEGSCAEHDTHDDHDTSYHL